MEGPDFPEFCAEVFALVSRGHDWQGEGTTVLDMEGNALPAVPQSWAMPLIRQCMMDANSANATLGLPRPSDHEVRMRFQEIDQKEDEMLDIQELALYLAAVLGNIHAGLLAGRADSSWKWPPQEEGGEHL